MASYRHPAGTGVHASNTYFPKSSTRGGTPKRRIASPENRKAAAAKDQSVDAADPTYCVLPRPTGIGGIPDFWVPWLTCSPFSLVKHELFSNDTHSEGVSTDPAPASVSRRQIASKKHLQRSSAIPGQPSDSAIGGA